MNLINKSLRVFFLSFLLLNLLLVTNTLADSKEEKKEIKVNQEGFTSSTVCSQCHSEIYKSWSNSMHAASVSDPVFEASYLNAIKNNGDDARKFCLSCHSPTTRITGDYYIKSSITTEGVTCSFCHTITSVELESGIPKITNNPGDIIRGPLMDLKSPGHKTEGSQLHLKSEFCAGCHELKGKNGAPILSTYSEWKESSYMKQGIQSHNSHMPEIFGVPIVDSDVKTTQNFAKDHSVLGGHSQIKLSKAASVLTKIKVENNKAVIEALV